jgi:regulator of replication initiation timing
MIKAPQRSLAPLFSLAVLSCCVGCTPDESPFRQENEGLRKQLAKQESVMNSLQDGNKVMQQQIDLLNQELRDAKKQAEHAQAEAKALQAEAKALGTKLDSQLAESKKLSGEIQRTAAKAAQATDNIRIEEKGSQVEDLPRPLAAVGKAAEEALARNGYRVKVSVKTDQKAIFVTERKVSTPTSLETSGSRNQYVVSLQALPSNVTRLSVKADFERLVQGGRVLAVDAEETAEIERRLIAEIGKAVASPSKL